MTDHQCSAIEFIGVRGHWRCACGRAYWNEDRYPDWDDRTAHNEQADEARKSTHSDGRDDGD